MALCLAFSACGFEPLEATRGSSAASASPTRTLLPVEIAPVSAAERRVAQLFRMALEDLVDPALTRQAQPYLLATGVELLKTPVFIRPDGTIARYNIALTVNYTLVRNADRLPLTSGSLRYINSYNVPDSDYAEFVAESDAISRGIEQLAEDLRLRLAGFFARKPDPDALPAAGPSAEPPPPPLPKPISILPRDRL